MEGSDGLVRTSVRPAVGIVYTCFAPFLAVSEKFGLVLWRGVGGCNGYAGAVDAHKNGDPSNRVTITNYNWKYNLPFGMLSTTS